MSPRALSLLSNSITVPKEYLSSEKSRSQWWIGVPVLHSLRHDPQGATNWFGSCLTFEMVLNNPHPFRRLNREQGHDPTIHESYMNTLPAWDNQLPSDTILGNPAIPPHDRISVHDFKTQKLEHLDITKDASWDLALHILTATSTPHTRWSATYSYGQTNTNSDLSSRT